MSKKKQPARRTKAEREKPAADATPDSKKSSDVPKKKHGQDGTRETVESVVIAFILAFLFRAYEAEAFVIPTGSMAPTLYGRHKEADCEKCGYHFTLGASDEVDNDGYLDGTRIETAVCPNCRFPDNNVFDLPPFTGDRILVNKFPFEFGDPKRWDVTVFKFPEQPRTNYIKRLVGLPGETILLRRGDVYRKNDDGSETILRKDDPDQQNAIQIPVYDDNHPAQSLLAAGWPERWAAMEPTGDDAGIAGWTEKENGWQHETEARQFRLDNASQGIEWLRYRHFVPTDDVWEALAEGGAIDNPEPRLVADFCGYNAFSPSKGGHLYDPTAASFWVGDLTVSGHLEIIESAADSQVILELNEGIYRYRCTISPDSGAATLARNVPMAPGEWEELGTAETKLQGPGTYNITFANVDNRLCLWVSTGWFDSGLVDFDGKNEFDVPRSADPTPRDLDLIPVAIGAKGIVGTISQLTLARDIYYQGEALTNNGTWSGRPYDPDRFSGGTRMIWEYHGREDRRPLFQTLGNPLLWGEEYERKPISGNTHAGSDVEIAFELGEDEYLMLGDNSPRSKDSRLWGNRRRAAHRHAVPRSALVGKAFFVYWPHGVPFMKDGKGFPVRYHRRRTFEGLEPTEYPSFRVPFYPNVGRMHRIR